MKFSPTTLRGIRRLTRELEEETGLVDGNAVEEFLGSSQAGLASIRVNPDLTRHEGPKQLFDFQQDLETEIVQKLKHQSAVLATLPTGAGKTFTATNAAMKLLSSTVRHVVWLAPLNVLVQQARNELERSWWWEKRDYDILMTGLEDSQKARSETRHYEFLTIQSLTRTSRLPHLGEETLVVLDEAHHLEANVFGDIAKRFKLEGAKVLGLTATPWRNNVDEQNALFDLFDGNLTWPKLLGENPIEVLQARGVYATLEVKELTQAPPSVGNALRRKRLGVRAQEASMDARRLESVVEEVKRSSGKRILIFCYSLAQCVVVAAALTKVQVAAEMVSGEFDLAWNRGVLQRFSDGATKVVVSAKYIATGVDLPKADVCVLMVPVSSASTYEQIVGRIARGISVGGTERAEIWEFDRNFQTHGGLQSYGRSLREWSIQR